MRSAALLRSQIEARIPAAFARYARASYEVIPTGIPQIDELIEGIPISALTEVCGSQAASSGKTSFLLSLLAQATRMDCCALVDATDSFHPESAEAAGVHLPRLAWIRCDASTSHLRALRSAMKITDMLLKAGGFRVIVADLSGIEPKLVRKLPLSCWHSFSLAVEAMPTALLFLQSVPCANSSARLVLNLKANNSDLSSQGLSHTRLFRGLQIEVEVARVRGAMGTKKLAQSARSQFTARTQWG